MASVNKVILLGRLGNQPELRYTPANRAVTELRLAVSRSWTDRTSGQKQEKTDWFSIDVWDKQAENCERYLTKGREVYIEGRLSIDEWNDKETQQKRTKIKITADQVQFIGGAKSDGDGGAPRGGGGGGGFESGGNRSGSTGPAPGMGDPGPDDFGGGDDIPF